MTEKWDKRADTHSIAWRTCHLFADETTNRQPRTSSLCSAKKWHLTHIGVIPDPPAIMLRWTRAVSGKNCGE